MEYVHLLLFISIISFASTLIKTKRYLKYDEDCYYEAKEKIKDITKEINEQDVFNLINIAFALLLLPSFIYFLLSIFVIKKTTILILAIVYLCEKILRISVAKNFIKEDNVPYNYAWNVFSFIFNLFFSFNVAYYCMSILF